MKRFLNIFKDSFNELKGKNKINCIVITGLMIAVSMVIEMFTIELPFAKINFSFIAIAAIGMFYGPFISFFSSGICDILGYIVHPDGAFIPTYTLIAMLQGLIYGIVLYHKWGSISDISSKRTKKVTVFTIRIVVARLLDVAIVNLIINTAANMHYHFIPKEAFTLAISARAIKNLLELAVDIPLMIAVLPSLLYAYNKVLRRNDINNII